MSRTEIQKHAAFIFLLVLFLLCACSPAASGQPRSLEGTWVAVDSTEAPTLFVVDRLVYRVEKGGGSCVMRPTKVRWQSRAALSVEGDTSRGRREKWRFQLTTDGDTAIVRHNFDPILYRRDRSQNPTERCMIDRAEPEERFSDSIPTDSIP